MKLKSAAFILSLMTFNIFAFDYTVTHRFHESKYDAQSAIKDLQARNIERLYRGEKKIIITIDDGPTSWATPKVLDVLDKHNVKATFFVIGNQAKDPKNQSIMERMQASGHIIGNHSLSHKHFGQISGFFGIGIKGKVLDEFLGGHDAIAPFISDSQQLYFRAPGASWSGKAAKYINQTDIGKKYIGPILWDIGGEVSYDQQGNIQTAADWACWAKKLSVNECLNGYLNRTQQVQGGVVLFHDINSLSAKLIDQYITEAKKLGYEFITLDDVPLE